MDRENLNNTSSSITDNLKAIEKNLYDLALEFKSALEHCEYIRMYHLHADIIRITNKTGVKPPRNISDYLDIRFLHNLENLEAEILSHGNDKRRMIPSLSAEEKERIAEDLYDLRDIVRKEASEEHSRFLSVFLSSDGKKHFWEFIKWWDLSTLRKEDYITIQGRNRSLAERVYGKMIGVAAASDDTALMLKMEATAKRILSEHPEFSKLKQPLFTLECSIGNCTPGTLGYIYPANPESQTFWRNMVKYYLKKDIELCGFCLMMVISKYSKPATAILSYRSLCRSFINEYDAQMGETEDNSFIEYIRMIATSDEPRPNHQYTNMSLIRMFDETFPEKERYASYISDNLLADEALSVVVSVDNTTATLLVENGERTYYCYADTFSHLPPGTILRVKLNSGNEILSALGIARLGKRMAERCRKSTPSLIIS